MSLSVFQTAQIVPLNTQTIPINKTLSSNLLKPILPIHNPLYRSLVSPPLAGKVRRSLVVVKASSSSAVVDGDTIAGLERCFRSSPPSDSPSSSSVMYGPVMEANYSSSGGVTLEKSKPIFGTTDKPKPYSPGTAVGGDGGDNGKDINNGGGGDGGDDNGDDDDYFDEFDDDDEGGLFRMRIVHPELFDPEFLEAVLKEWQKTTMDLPDGLRQAYEKGLVSSAQLVKYLAINARPTTARFISRAIPQEISRAFIGRMIADPAFLYRLLLEQATTIGCSVWWEVKNRKERIKQEWDLALINVLTVTACNAVVVWSLAPCRSYGNTFQFDLQNTVQKLPNNIFEMSYKHREFDLQKRVQSFFYKAAELCMVGFTAGAAQGALSNLSASKKEGRLSMTIPTMNDNALGYGAFLGLYANLCHQLLCGLDRTLVSHFDVIGVALFFSTAMRMLNVQVGEPSRLAWLGVEVDPLAHSDNLLKAYERPSKAVDQPSSSKWFISKNAFVSGLGLLGIKEGQSESTAEGETPQPKARRKRIKRKKSDSKLSL